MINQFNPDPKCQIKYDAVIETFPRHTLTSHSNCLSLFPMTLVTRHIAPMIAGIIMA